MKQVLFDILPRLKCVGFLDTNAWNPSISTAGITHALQFGEVSFMNLVRDKGDDRAFKLLWNFQSENDMTIQNICHESFHAAMSVCQHCNMSLGFKVGEDEHAAYIAGFVGNCAGEMFGFLEEEKDGKEE